MHNFKCNTYELVTLYRIRISIKINQKLYLNIMISNSLLIDFDNENVHEIIKNVNIKCNLKGIHAYCIEIASNQVTPE